MGVDARIDARLLPEDLASRANAMAMSRFIAECGTSWFLLLKLDDAEQDLERGLSASVSIGAREQAAGALPFRTAKLEDPSSSIAPWRPAPGSVERCTTLLRRALTQGPCFAAPIEKRCTDGPLAHVTLGRAPNVDVMLRHSSISKLHAWLESSPSGAICIADAGSTNGTRVNGELITPRQPVELQPGDTLYIGRLDALLCSTEALWRALREEPDP